MSNWICCTNAGIFPIEIYLSVKKQKKTYFLGIKPGQLVELYEIQNRQLIFSFMSNPTNFGINGSNCVVAFLGVWIVSSGGFLWEDFGRQPSVVVWGSEAALEGIEGERGRVWGCTVLLGRWDLFCQWWQTRQQPGQLCPVRVFLGQLGWRLPMTSYSAGSGS